MTEPVAAVIAEDTPDLSPTPAPDRADAPVSEITERFLRAVLAKVPLDHIEELHLFSPLRQSGVETGIAVIAALVPAVAPLAALAPEFDLDDAVEPVDPVVMAAAVDVALEDDATAQDETAHDETAHDATAQGETAQGETAQGESEQHESDDAVDAVLASMALEIVEAGVEEEDGPADAVIPDAVITPMVRHTVYTARYRLVQKGPERGRWESEVVAEADAPLITVEMVVRGVQRRAGEESEILRYSAKQIARALRMPWPTPTPTPAPGAPSA